MVLPAVLRDAAFDPAKAHRCARAVRVDADAGIHSLARYVARALCPLSAHVQVALLVACDHRRHPWHLRLGVGRCQLQHSVAVHRYCVPDPVSCGLGRSHRHSLLLRLLLAADADHRPDRAAEADSGQHCKVCSRFARSAAGRMRMPNMRTTFGPGLLLAALVSATAVTAQTTEPARAPKSVEWSFNGPFGQYDRAS